jgi:hypothetical protein
MDTIGGAVSKVRKRCSFIWLGVKRPTTTKMKWLRYQTVISLKIPVGYTNQREKMG